MVLSPCKSSGTQNPRFPVEHLFSMSNFFEPRAALVTQIRLLLRVSCQSNASSESARRGKFESLLYLNVFTDAVHTAYWLQALDCSFWSAEQPLPEPQQAGQSQGMNRDCSLLDRIQPPWQEGFNVILPVLWQASMRWPVTGRGKHSTKQINPLQSICQTLQV